MKTKLQVVGTSSAKCNHLAAAAEASARRLGLDFQMERVVEIARFADFGVVETPALIVNGVLKAAGRVPKEAELDRLLTPKS